MYIERHLKGRLTELLGDFRIVHLAGPRQSGKSTIARALAGEIGMEYVTLDDAGLLASARSDPQGLLAALPRLVVLDEFQQVSELVSAIKMVSDAAAGQKGIFLLTGSADVFRSARVQEALPGHMARVELYPLSWMERRAGSRNIIDLLIHGQFEPVLSPALDRVALAELLIQGGYPEAVAKSPRSRGVWFASYVEGRLLKDLRPCTRPRVITIRGVKAADFRGPVHLRGLCGGKVQPRGSFLLRRQGSSVQN